MQPSSGRVESVANTDKKAICALNMTLICGCDCGKGDCVIRPEGPELLLRLLILLNRRACRASQRSLTVVLSSVKGDPEPKGLADLLPSAVPVPVPVLAPVRQKGGLQLSKPDGSLLGSDRDGDSDTKKVSPPKLQPEPEPGLEL